MIYIEQNATNNIFVNVSQYKTGDFGANPRYLWRLQNSQGRNIVSFYPENATSTYPSMYANRYDVFSFDTFKNLPQNFNYTGGTPCNIWLENENQYWLGVYEMPSGSTSYNPSSAKLLNSLAFVFVDTNNDFYTGNTANFEPNKIYYKNGNGITPTPSNTASPTPTPSITPSNTASPTPTPSITPTNTSSPTPTPSITPTNTSSPTPTPTQTPSNTPNPLCPQQLDIIGSPAQPGFTGTYSRLSVAPTQTFTSGYIQTAPNPDTFVFGVAPDGNNYAAFGFQSGGASYMFARVFSNTTNNGWIQYITSGGYLYEGGVVAAFGPQFVNTGNLYDGSVYYPITGRYGFGAFPLVNYYNLSYPISCPTATPTPTPTPTPTITPS